MSSSILPPVSELLSGYAFNNSSPGTPLHLTYYFETSVPVAGSWKNDLTWTPLSVAEQTYVQQAMANVAAFANVTFTQIYQTAQINYGNSTSSDQDLMGTSFGKTEGPTPEDPVAYTAFNGADFTPTPYYPAADNEYLAAHELGNALGLLDYYGPTVPWTIPAQYTNSNYTTMAGGTFNTSNNAPPGYESPVGFQMLDILALQYLYGVNESGFTPGYQNTVATLTGSDLTYSITNNSADETIWVGSNVASVKCLDFSACTSSVAINLNAGTFSSSFVGPAIYSGYAAGGNESIAIALNTVINVGVSDNQASALIADSTPLHNDVLLGGTGNDSFTAGAGKDIFIGGGGIDTVIFHDAMADYSITTLGAGVMMVTDNAPAPTDGTVVLDGSFTSLQFADKTVTEAANLRPEGLAAVISAPTAILSANLGAIDYLLGGGEISSFLTTNPTEPVNGSFTGNGTSDILWYDNTTGDTGYWLMSGGQASSWYDFGDVSIPYSVAGAGDFNGNGTSDILWRNGSTGDTGFWSMPLGGGQPTWDDLGTVSTAYSVAGVGDFIGSGTDDILWRDASTGDTGYWTMSGGKSTGWTDLGNVSTAYNVVGVGDFTGNGISDILWQNSTTGDTGIYLLNGSGQSTWLDLGDISFAYPVVGIGDFNGDGIDDILFRDASTGDTGYYEMNSSAQPTWVDLGTVSTAYSVIGVGDFTGNDISDILWRDSATGDTGYWAMNNSGKVGGWVDLGATPSTYKVPTPLSTNT